MCIPEYLMTRRFGVVLGVVGDLMLISEFFQMASISNLLMTGQFIHLCVVFAFVLGSWGLVLAPGVKELTSATIIPLSSFTIGMCGGGKIKASLLAVANIILD